MQDGEHIEHLLFFLLTFLITSTTRSVAVFMLGGFYAWPLSKRSRSYCGDVRLLDTVRPCLGGGPRVVVSTATFHARVRGSVPGLGGFKETKMFLLHPRVKVSIVGSVLDREVACSASDRRGSNFESCFWRAVSSWSSQNPQKVLLVQFGLYVHRGGLKPHSFYLFTCWSCRIQQ